MNLNKIIKKIIKKEYKNLKKDLKIIKDNIAYIENKLEVIEKECDESQLQENLNFDGCLEASKRILNSTKEKTIQKVRLPPVKISPKDQMLLLVLARSALILNSKYLKK